MQKDRRPKTLTIDEQINNVANAIKHEIKNMPETYLRWPPCEDELLGSNTTIPPLLNNLMTSILSRSRKKRLRERKKKIISSICQDIIYTSTNGKHRCSKHVLLSFTTKRKTGSKLMIRWLNSLGHGISYDEVNYLETSLAEAVENESIKSYCPSAVLPSVFVTFVWDNNDINPESIRGIYL